MLFLPEARRVRRQAAGEGCHIIYPLMELPDPSNVLAMGRKVV